MDGPPAAAGCPPGDVFRRVLAAGAAVETGAANGGRDAFYGVQGTGTSADAGAGRPAPRIGADAGATNACATDAGAADAGAADASVADFGAADFGVADFGVADFGAADFDAADSGVATASQRRQPASSWDAQGPATRDGVAAAS